MKKGVSQETNARRAIRLGMMLMPRYRQLDDLMTRSATGDWVKFADVRAHYEVVASIIERAELRAKKAEKDLALFLHP